MFRSRRFVAQRRALATSWLAACAMACGSSPDPSATEPSVDAGARDPRGDLPDAASAQFVDAGAMEPTDAGATTQDAATCIDCGGDCIDVRFDPTHCGRCDNVCQPGATCEYGGCLDTLTDDEDIYEFALDDSHVWWVIGYTSLRRAPIVGIIEGGGPETVLEDVHTFEHLAVDETHLYWTVPTNSITNEGTGQVWRMPRAFGAYQQLAANQHMPNTLTLGDGYVYWTTESIEWNALTHRGPARVMRVRSDGSGSAQLLAEIGAYGFDISVDDAFVYYRDFDAHAMRVSNQGGEPANIVPGESLIGSVISDGESVFWTDRTHGTVNAMPRDGGEVRTLADAQIEPASLAEDGAYVYWSDYAANDDATIRRVPKEGGATEVLATQQRRAADFAFDATHVYWTNGHIVRRQK